MIKYLKLACFLLVAGYLFASCNTAGEPNPLSQIPSDATFVAEINGKAFLSKSGLNNPDDYKFMNMGRLIGGEQFAFVEALCKGSKDAGVSADNILICLTSPKEISAYAKVLDVNALEGWLKKLGLEEPVRGDGYKGCINKEGICMAWNEKQLIVSAKPVPSGQIAELFSEKKDGLLAVNEDFKKFAERKADMRSWLKYSLFSDLYKAFSGDVLSPLTEQMKDVGNLSVHGYLDFNDGKIVASGSINPPSEVAKYVEKYPLAKEAFNTELYGDLPEKAYLQFNVAINVIEYFKLFRQTLELNLQKYNGDESANSEEMKKFLDGPELKSVLDALDGDILFSIHGFKQSNIPMPEMTLVFSVKGESAFNDILALIPKDQIVKSPDGYYVYDNPGMSELSLSLSFAFKNNRVIVSNDLESTAMFVGKKKGKTFADNPVSATIGNRPAGFCINLDLNSYPDNFKLFLRNFIKGGSYDIFASIIDIYDKAYAMGRIADFEAVLQFKNPNVNSLKQIFKSVDKISSGKPSSWNQ
ncbi:MAG: DUF4836 family protein [Prevotellaceae bacterium]|jgi:Cu/Ag efflux protein CusF|nr:DUF4836 family protein [Prevotellaceae bacterium]